jgi:ribonucleoside-triphosphate reductase
MSNPILATQVSEKEEVQERCGKSTEVYSRVVGFYRPVKQWNLGKKEDCKDRRTYEVAGR